MTCSSIPSQTIRTFHTDDRAFNPMDDGVDRHRGAIAFTQPLFILPGRLAEHGPNLTVAVRYQSDVAETAMTRNHDAPTGVLGLGFSLPLAAIVLEDHPAVTPGARRYRLGPDPGEHLVVEPEPPFLFTIPALDLAVGRTVSTELVIEFGKNGIALSSDAVVTALSDDHQNWEVDDRTRQQVFTLTRTHVGMEVYDGGMAFQAIRYRFWKILYYPRYERWLVITETGLRRTFGGIGQLETDGRMTSQGNCIAWGVRWMDGQGHALWCGASTRTENQQHFARAWYLQEECTIWGDRIKYHYNEFPTDPTNGLVPGCQQRVGHGGKVYTKAIYLTSITDALGRRVRFRYSDKVWGDDHPETPREYADPHKPVPNDDANAFQDCYETRYLDTIEVDDACERRLFSIQFDYAPRPELPTPARAVANVTAFSGALRGDTYKRFLTAITLRRAEGGNIPGFRFAYHLHVTATHGGLGALARIIRPSGATVSYGYQRQTLPRCDRSRIVARARADGSGVDDPSTSGGRPRCWFGVDYIVVTWYDRTQGQLALQVLTWTGCWQSWHFPNGPTLVHAPDEIEEAALMVTTAPLFFTVQVAVAGAAQLYVVRKHPRCPGNWQPATLNDGTITARNQPTLKQFGPGAQVLVGTDYLLFVMMNAAAGDFYYDRLTWDWRFQHWRHDRCECDFHTYIAAAPDCYVMLDAGHHGLSLWSLTARLTWDEGPVNRFLPRMNLSSYEDVAVSATSGLLAVGNRVGTDADGVRSQLYLVQWDDRYELHRPRIFVDLRGPTTVDGGDVPAWAPVVVTTGMVAVAGTVFRFDGVTWWQNRAFAHGTPRRCRVRHDVYGDDLMVRTVFNPGHRPEIQVLGFDANRDGGSWSRVVPVTIPGNPDDAEMERPRHGPCRPSPPGADFLRIGSHLFYRDWRTDWCAVIEAGPVADLTAVAAAAHGTEAGPYRLTGSGAIDHTATVLTVAVITSNASPTAALIAVMLGNGGILCQAERLPDQGHVDADAAAAGRSGFVVTAPDTQAGGNALSDAAGKVQVARAVGGAIHGAIGHDAVTVVSVADGFGETWLGTYVYDLDSAAAEADGRTVRYHRVTAYPGTETPARPVYGWITETFVNGLAGNPTGQDRHGVLDGARTSRCVFRSNGTALTETRTTWHVFTHRADTPFADTARARALAGGFCAPIRDIKVQSGVAHTRTYSHVPDGLFSPFSGQTVRTSVTAVGGSGRPETVTETVHYAYEVYPICLTLNLLTCESQRIATWALERDAPITMWAHTTVHTAWPSANGSAVLVPAEKARFQWTGGVPTAFPYDATVDGPIPTGWTPIRRIHARTSTGLVLEEADANGVITSTLYSTATSLPLVVVGNASAKDGQFAFWGFGSDEIGNGFHNQGGRITDSDSHFGLRSLALPEGARAALSVTVQPSNRSQTYLLGFWSKTSAGFVTDGRSGWTVLVSTGGVTGEPTGLPFADTGGTWRYRTLGIPIKPGSHGQVISATATNTGTGTVLLDGIVLMPLDATLTAMRRDDRFGLVTAKMDAAGRICRRLYDADQRPTIEIGPADVTLRLRQVFASRQSGSAEGFDAASPNAEITVEATHGGTTETFRDGGEWRRRWDAWGSASSWRVADGALHHVSVDDDRLVWRGWPGQAPETVALLVDIEPAGSLFGSVGLGFGHGYRVVFTPEHGYRLEFQDSGLARPPLANPPAMARTWLLVLAQGQVLFFGDGQLLFSIAIDAGSRSALALETGPNRLCLRSLTVVAGPRLQLVHADALGRDRQRHRLIARPDGRRSDALVSAVIYDGLGRPIVRTRTAPANFGRDAALPLLVYRPRFVDGPAFRAAVTGSWRLAGDVCDYHALHHPGADTDGTGDHAGYAYHGTRYPDAVSMQPDEIGQPGRTWAIHDVDRLTPTERRTTRHEEGRHGAAEFGLPDGAFLCRRVVSPTGTVLTTLVDARGTPVAVSVAADDVP